MNVSRERDEAILKVSLSARPLVRVGNAWAVLLPKFWVEAYGLRRFGRIWVRKIEDADKVILQALDPMEVYELIGEEGDESAS